MAATTSWNKFLERSSITTQITRISPATVRKKRITSRRRSMGVNKAVTSSNSWLLPRPVQTITRSTTRRSWTRPWRTRMSVRACARKNTTSRSRSQTWQVSTTITRLIVCSQTLERRLITIFKAEWLELTVETPFSVPHLARPRRHRRYLDQSKTQAKLWAKANNRRTIVIRLHQRDRTLINGIHTRNNIKMDLTR